MTLVFNLSCKLVQKAAVAYVSDNNVSAYREEAESDMNKMIKIYNDLHKVSGGNMQEEKVNLLGRNSARKLDSK